jgi:transposase-like protein
MIVVFRDRQSWLWRAVDNEREVFDILIKAGRDATSAARLKKKLVKRQRKAIIV